MFNVFRLGRQNRSNCSIRQCCFDIVAVATYLQLLYIVQTGKNVKINEIDTATVNETYQ